MGISSSTIMAVSGSVQAGSSLLYGATQASQSKADAEGIQDQARQQSERVLRATARQRGAARAATAASGAKVDEFSLGVEQDIQEAGETDSANVLLGAARNARSLKASAKLQTAAGLGNASASLLEASYKGWKGAKGKPAASFHSGDYWRGGAGFEGE